MAEAATIGVIGGSGFYALLEHADEVAVETPFGPPSDLVAVGDVAGRRVAFLPRHGRDHRFPPHKIPYRANLWALRSLGVRQVLAPCAVGSLTALHQPGALVIPDQLIDRTAGREQTYYEAGAAVHIGFADPYCPAGRELATEVSREAGWPGGAMGTLVVTEGPRFSTRAESRWYASLGGTVIGMTGHPEAALARELAMCYTALALVTDADAGVAEGEGVTQDEVFGQFALYVARLRELVLALVGRLPSERACPCSRALDGIRLPFVLP